MFKSFFKGLLFDFDGQLSSLIVGNYNDIVSNFSSEDLYNLTLQSQARQNQIIMFLENNLGNDYYARELADEIAELNLHFNITSINPDFIGTFQGSQYAIRWNILTASFDYVKQFLHEDGVDSAFFYNLYKSSLKRCEINPIKMI